MSATLSRRAHPRKACALPVNLEGEGATLAARVLDISIGGMHARIGFEAGHVPLRVGSKVSLQINPSEDDIIGSGEVVWIHAQDDFDFGVAFYRFTERNQRALVELLVRLDV